MSTVVILLIVIIILLCADRRDERYDDCDCEGGCE